MKQLFMSNTKAFSIIAIVDVRCSRNKNAFVNILEATRASYVKLYDNSLYISAISARQKIASCVCWPLKANNVILLSDCVHAKFIGVI